ncbi:MAG TPA: glycosyltransferase family 4 protein [Acidobacteriota bacterium]|nr:glycosyltransferase family 4 protein [Acidobacteriota bacterium]
MRIALLGPAPPLRGGISQYNSLLHKAFADQGHETLLVSFLRQYPEWLLPGKKQFDPEAEGRDQAALRLLDSVRPSTWKRTFRRLAGFRPDLVVLQWWHPFMAPCYRGVLRGLSREIPSCKSVMVCHNVLSHEHGRFPGRAWVERLLVRTLFKHVDAFVAHGREIISTIREVSSGQPVLKAFLPIQDYHFSPHDPGPQPRAEDEPSRLLFFGNVRQYKGLDTLLEALARLPGDLRWRLTVAGEFYLSLESFQRQARDLGLADRVEWKPGYLRSDQLPALFRSSDLLVLPYRAASQSGIIPLAFLFELPVLATRVGGLPDVIEHGRNGLLVPPDDPGRLAAAIEDFLRDDPTGHLLPNIRAFRRQLSWEQVTDTILQASGEADRQV